MIIGKHWSEKSKSNCSTPESGELKYRMTYDSKCTYSFTAISYFQAREKCRLFLQSTYGIVDAEQGKLVIVRVK